MLAKHALSQLSYGPILRRRDPRISPAAHSGRANPAVCLRLATIVFAGSTPVPPASANRKVCARSDRDAELTRGTRAGGAHTRMVGLGRLELPTSRLSSARSNQLSYKPELLLKPFASAAQSATAERARPGRKRNEGGEVPQNGSLNEPLFQVIR